MDCERQRIACSVVLFCFVLLLVLRTTTVPVLPRFVLLLQSVSSLKISTVPSEAKNEEMREDLQNIWILN